MKRDYFWTWKFQFLGEFLIIDWLIPETSITSLDHPWFDHRARILARIHRKIGKARNPPARSEQVPSRTFSPGNSKMVGAKGRIIRPLSGPRRLSFSVSSTFGCHLCRAMECAASDSTSHPRRLLCPDNEPRPRYMWMNPCQPLRRGSPSATIRSQPEFSTPFSLPLSFPSIESKVLEGMAIVVSRARNVLPFERDN